MIEVLQCFFNHYKIKYNKSFLKARLQEIPYKDSLYAVGLVLKNYGVITESYIISDETSVTELPETFFLKFEDKIKFCYKKDNLFYFENTLINIEEIIGNIILKPIPTNLSKEINYIKNRNKTIINKLIWTVLIVLLNIMTIANFGIEIIPFSIGNLFLLLITLAMSTSDVLLNSKICKIGEKISCNDVAKSKYSRLFNVKLDKIFISYLITNLFVSKYILLDSSYFYISIFGLVFCVYLLFIQLFVIKKICLYCISIYILFGLITYVNTHIYPFDFILNINTILSIVKYSVIYGLIIFLYVYVSEKNNTIKETNIDLSNQLQFYKDESNIFESLLFDSDLIIKDTSNIDIVFSFKCRHCKKILSDLISYAEIIELKDRVRLVFMCSNIEEANFAKHICNFMIENSFIDSLKEISNSQFYINRQLYSQKNLEHIGNIHYNRPSKDSILIYTGEKFTVISEIIHLPTILYNGYIIPYPYTLKDVLYLSM